VIFVVISFGSKVAMTNIRNHYILAPPPRQVPSSIRCQLLFGGFSNQFGWFFFGFGLIFFWVFAANADLLSAVYYRGDLETVTGKALYSEKTSASENRTRVYANHYSFVYGGVEYNGISYATGDYFSGGEQVTVEFPNGRLDLSRIQGMRRSIFGTAAIFVVIFPAVGLGFIAFGLVGGIKANRLLTNGKLGMGRLKLKEPTNTRINHQMVYKYTFEFNDEIGRNHNVVSRTHIIGVLEDEQEERLLYDPNNPSYAVMMDSLPASPAIDSMGNIVDAKPLRGLLVLIAPGISIIGNGAYLLLKFFI
jgi:hypothetical protein